MERQQQLTTEFLANRHSLFAFIYGFVRNTHDAEDIFQEVWIRLSSALGQGVAIQDLGKWCRGTARNLVLHYWRDRRNDKVIVDQELMDLVEQAFDEQEENQQYWRARQSALSECIENLPTHSKDLLRLKYEKDMSVQKVADELARSAAAVMMALSRLRQALRDCAQKKLKLLGIQA
jgi:RNA polymerase sigma-70 factor, ECF subfamily